MRTLFASASLLTLVVACGSSGASTPGDGGADAATIREPKVHRALPETCPADRPASNPPANPGACKSDADCTQGKNGRCVSIALAPSVCTYDECTVDKDCGAGVCMCRDLAAGGANACRQGNCRTDGDCGVVGKGFCSPSAVTLDVYCRTGIPAGSFGYFCHTPTDECTNDSDCGEAGLQGSCMFDVQKQHWACHGVLCSD